ncbi:MAG: hypothetical protein KA419_08945 [Acidobacteria bacterium]|nr:hypothetical protein [Acidobacteriota bacterium]
MRLGAIGAVFALYQLFSWLLFYALILLSFRSSSTDPASVFILGELMAIAFEALLYHEYFRRNSLKRTLRKSLLVSLLGNLLSLLLGFGAAWILSRLGY